MTLEDEIFGSDDQVRRNAIRHQLDQGQGGKRALLEAICKRIYNIENPE